MEEQRGGPESSLSIGRFLGIAGQQLIGTVVGILAGMALARMLSTAAFGEFNAAYGVMIMAAALASMGLGQYITVPFRKAMASGEFETARGLRRWIPWCILAAGALTYAIVLATHVALGSGSLVRVESFAAVLAMVPLIGLMTYLVATANTHGAAGRAMFISVSGLQLMILLGLGAAWLMKDRSFDLLDAAAIWAGATMVVCIGLWRLNLAVEPPDFKEGQHKTAWQAWAQGTLPYLLSGLVNVFLVQAPFLILGWIHADGEAAAMFAAADRLAQLLAVAGLAGTAIFLPPIADAIREGSRAGYRYLIRRWFLIVGTSNLMGIVLLAVFGQTLLGFFGSDYQHAYVLLLVVASSIGVAMVLSIFLSVVQFAGGGRTVVIVSSCWTVAGLAGMIALGDQWGAMGIAIAQGATFLGMYLTFVVRAVGFVGRRLH